MINYQIIGTSTDANGSTTAYNFGLSAIDTGITSSAQLQANLFYGFVLFFLVSSLIIGYFSSKFKKR